MGGGAFERTPASRVAELSPIYHRGLSSSLQTHALAVTVIIITLGVCTTTTTTTTDAKDGGQCVKKTILRDEEPPMFSHDRPTFGPSVPTAGGDIGRKQCLRCPGVIRFLEKNLSNKKKSTL